MSGGWYDAEHRNPYGRSPVELALAVAFLIPAALVLAGDLEASGLAYALWRWVAGPVLLGWDLALWVGWWYSDRWWPR
jgi:hypothetical protein